MAIIDTYEIWDVYYSPQIKSWLVGVRGTYQSYHFAKNVSFRPQAPQPVLQNNNIINKYTIFFMYF